MFGLSTFGPYVVAGAVLHAASRKLLLWKLLWDKECRGISLISQVSCTACMGLQSSNFRGRLNGGYELRKRLRDAMQPRICACMWHAAWPRPSTPAMTVSLPPCSTSSHGCACMCHDHTPCTLPTLRPALPQELWLCVYVARYMDLLYLFESFGVELIKVRLYFQWSDWAD